MTKILILGHARHGKDTVAEFIVKHTNLKFKSATNIAADIIYPILADILNYKSKEECLDDKANRRALWFELIRAYNNTDRARLAKLVCLQSDIYCGMRDIYELQQCRELKLFDHILWVHNSSKGFEDFASFNIPLTKDMYDIYNNSDLAFLEAQVIKFITKFNVHIDIKNANLDTLF